MEKKLIVIQEFCNRCQVEPEFIDALEEEDIIRFPIVEGEKVIEEERLQELEQFVRWHYEMHINLEGIDALRHVLLRLKKTQEQVTALRNRLDLYE